MGLNYIFKQPLNHKILLLLKHTFRARIEALSFFFTFPNLNFDINNYREAIETIQLTIMIKRTAILNASVEIMHHLVQAL